MKKTRKRWSTEEFIEKCKQIHGDKYTYDKTVYTKMHAPIIVTCLKHGDFTIHANEHSGRGYGCSKCAHEKSCFLQKDTTESFIKKSKQINGDRYDYSKTIYGKNAHEKIILTCKEHGDFMMTPNSHLSRKCGCSKCIPQGGWTKISWRNICKNKIPKLYILKCFNEEEIFYKIGITSSTVEHRFRSKHWMPYKYEILKIIESTDSDFIFSLERKLHKENTQFLYKPKIWFDGFTECFSNYINTH